MLLLVSIPKSMMAEVAINISFSRLNAARVIPLIAPPVPNNPAKKPDITPPPMEFFRFGFNSKFFKINKVELNKIRKIESAISRYFVPMYFPNIAPTITKSIAGIPIERINFLSNPFRKKNIFDKLLKT